MKRLSQLTLVAMFFVLFCITTMSHLSFAAGTWMRWNDADDTYYPTGSVSAELQYSYGYLYFPTSYVSSLDTFYDGGMMMTGYAAGNRYLNYGEYDTEYTWVYNNDGGAINGSLGAWSYASIGGGSWGGCSFNCQYPYFQGTFGIYLAKGSTNSVVHEYVGDMVYYSDAQLSSLDSMGTPPPFSTNARRAVVLTAFYALRQSHDGGCDKTIPSTNGNCVSGWNFLNDQTNLGPQALSDLDAAYGYSNCYASNWAVSSDACYVSGYTSPSFYSNLANYGYGEAGGDYGSVGRGGQCVFFANNILYRSQSEDAVALAFASMESNSEPDLQEVVEGDVLFLYGDTAQGFTTNHVSIVVQVYKSAGTVTAVDVIDSNYKTDLYISGVPVSNREVITRHAFCAVDFGGDSGCPFYDSVQMIQGHYKIWKGTDYYNTIYDPN